MTSLKWAFPTFLLLALLACDKSKPVEKPDQAERRGRSEALRPNAQNSEELVGEPRAASKNLIGRWCDKMAPKLPKLWIILEFEKQGDATIKRIIDRDGETFESELLAVGEKDFQVPESSSGDRYQIVPSDGSLQILDNEGLIRTARKLELTSSPNACFASNLR